MNGVRVMLESDQARQVLRDAGVRLTPQRLYIVDALVDNRSHPTVDALYAMVRQKYPNVSLATVYQTVALLGRHGLILELRGAGDALRCDPNTTPHAHAYCRGCGAVHDVPLPTALTEMRWDTAPFITNGVEISLKGWCTHCAPASATN